MAITNARMQIKRGNEVDFNSEKMFVGEWALSTDKRIVRICVAPNVCIRMATYDAFEVDMAQIEKILEECQTIEEAVTRINEEVSNNLNAVIEYVDEARQYRDEAKQFRDEAKVVANVDIATTETAGLVKPDGTTIRVDADGTIHADNGTVDYNELENKPQINNVELSGSKSLSDFGIASATDLQEVEIKVDTIIEKAELNIKNNASGENIHLTDSANSKVVEFGLYGKATQDGEPTPDNPIEITVSGSDGSVEVVSCGKNLLKNTATTKTINGVTFTVNEDGSVTANGTATDKTVLNLCDNPKFEDDCILMGCPNGGGSSTYCIEYSNYMDYSYKDYGSGININKFDYSSYPDSKVVLVVYKGTTVNNVTFYPMIRLASDTDDTYEPYKESTITVSTPNGFAGIPVNSDGNYTDANGQQWLCDEIIKYADGTGKKVQRIGKAALNGTEGVYKIASNGNGIAVNNANTSIFPNIKYGSNKDVPMISNIRKWENDSAWTVGSFGVEHNIFWFEDKGNVLFSTIDDWNNYLTTTNMHVLYPLSEPIITDLTAEEIAEIEKLHTFYPVTNISNDADCGMAVTYIADSKLYIDNQLAIQKAQQEEALATMLLLMPEEVQASMIENDTNNLLNESEV